MTHLSVSVAARCEIRSRRPPPSLSFISDLPHWRQLISGYWRRPKGPGYAQGAIHGLTPDRSAANMANYEPSAIRWRRAVSYTFLSLLSFCCVLFSVVVVSF